jgi:hypothetical protein
MGGVTGGVSISFGSVMLSHFRDLVQGSWRYATSLRGFLAVTIDLPEAEATLTAQLQNREETFLRLLELGVYGNPRSPYRRLLLHAGYEFDNVLSLVRNQGLESALATLYAAGVYVTLAEFKGRAPVRRPGLEFPVTEQDFDNPLLKAQYKGSTSGSRGGGTRVNIDFDFIAHEAAGYLVNLNANGMIGKPIAVWQGAPPSSQGLGNIFRLARQGLMPEKWFTPIRPGWNRQGVQARAMLAYTLLMSRLAGRPIPRPIYTPDAESIVAYLAAAVRRGTPAVLLCPPSQSIRVAQKAEELGADLSGTIFRGGGEPMTPGKAAVLARVGAEANPSYAMYESGTISYRCGAPAHPDDMHLLRDKLALLQQPKEFAPGFEVQAIILTTLLESTSKLMLNVETGDYATIEERDCGCLWQQLGFTTHIHHVRSYEKLTSESVSFMKDMLHELVEETLPARFGGGAIDYQLVEEEEDGLPRVSIVIAPSVGPLDEATVIETVLHAVGFSDWSRRQAHTWQEAGTLRVRRREPYATGSGKILPLHVQNTARPRPPRAEPELAEASSDAG